MTIGDDGWPLRASVEEAWRAVVAGRSTREDVHLWTVPWVEGDADVGPPTDMLVGTGLQYLHGLGMTVDPESPNLVGHGGPGDYLLSENEISARLDHWLELCRDYDADPAGFDVYGSGTSLTWCRRDMLDRFGLWFFPCCGLRDRHR